MTGRGRAHRVPGNPACPACGASASGAAHVGGEDIAPVPGDATVCVHCASLLTFDNTPDGGLLVRYPTDGELVEFIADPAVRAARRAVLALIRRRGTGLS
jgi:hypothetical protein